MFHQVKTIHQNLELNFQGHIFLAKIELNEYLAKIELNECFEQLNTRTIEIEAGR